MSVRRKINENNDVFFITITCARWLPLFKLTNGYDAVYKWFDYLKGQGHHLVAYVIMPNHLHAIIAFNTSGISINTIIGNGKRFMSYWLVPFGFFAGIGFSLVTDLHTFAWAGSIGNHIVGGLFGAFGGAMGSIFIGGGVGVATSSDSVPLRNRLDEGKYLIVVQGTDQQVVRANQLMRPLRPENIQGYVAP